MPQPLHHVLQLRYLEWLRFWLSFVRLLEQCRGQWRLEPAQRQSSAQGWSDLSKASVREDGAVLGVPCPAGHSPASPPPSKSSPDGSRMLKPALRLLGCGAAAPGSFSLTKALSSSDLRHSPAPRSSTGAAKSWQLCLSAAEVSPLRALPSATICRAGLRVQCAGPCFGFGRSCAASAPGAQGGRRVVLKPALSLNSSLFPCRCEFSLCSCALPPGGAWTLGFPLHHQLHARRTHDAHPHLHCLLHDSSTSPGKLE